jgi:probable rRNA maturation factor
MFLEKKNKVIDRFALSYGIFKCLEQRDIFFKLILNKLSEDTYLNTLNKNISFLHIEFLMSDEMKDTNFSLRGKKNTTDILSVNYPISENSLNGILYLDPLFIELIIQSKIEFANSFFPINFFYRIVELLIHGIVHLLGLDHSTDQEEKKMFLLEDSIKSSLLDDNNIVKMMKNLFKYVD